MEAKAIGIPVDHRRKNRSEESLKINVERVKAYRERLVVMPRRNKKNKGKVRIKRDGDRELDGRDSRFWVSSREGHGDGSLS